MPYYHVYNRGAHKECLFNDNNDYWRFLHLLYLTNDIKPIVFKSIKSDVFSVTKQKPVLKIFSYCLMPNHFHIGIISESEKDVAKFMHKLCTSYVMYYNKKYMHSGTIFQGTYKSKTVDTNEYLYTLLAYIHLNPYGIEEPNLMYEVKYDPAHYKRALEYSSNYEFSSFQDYLGIPRAQQVILTRIQGLTSE